MVLFLAGLVLLIVGYFTYGKFVEKVVGVRDADAPGVTMADGVDYVVLPRWKNMLIQLLNIAGIGPVIGVILGIKFGSIVFILLPIGNILAGATHDFISGFMSVREGGANLPLLVRKNLGRGVSRLFSAFMIFLLLLVAAVFVNIPANLANQSLVVSHPEFWCKDAAEGAMALFARRSFWVIVGIVFCYYVAAAMFPVDKIIGRLYPFFGLLLLVGTAAIFVALLRVGFQNPALLTETPAFKEQMWTPFNNHPVIPLLFVTIACGIISGFHATQSPIVARTMRNERECRATFYGMMVVEGLIGMIWAGAGMAIYNLFPAYMQLDPTMVLGKITDHFLGSSFGTITIWSVIILAITSGDTALRSTRLALAEILHVNREAFLKRFLMILPLLVIVVLLLLWSNQSAKTFGQLWNYFAWGNQVLAATTLFTAAAWLWKEGRNGWVAMLPGMFMTFIVLCYIFWISPEHGGPVGCGMDLPVAYGFAGNLTVFLALLVWGKNRKFAPKQ